MKRKAEFSVSSCPDWSKIEIWAWITCRFKHAILQQISFYTDLYPCKNLFDETDDGARFSCSWRSVDQGNFWQCIGSKHGITDAGYRTRLTCIKLVLFLEDHTRRKWKKTNNWRNDFKNKSWNLGFKPAGEALAVCDRGESVVQFQAVIKYLQQADFGTIPASLASLSSTKPGNPRPEIEQI